MNGQNGQGGYPPPQNQPMPPQGGYAQPQPQAQPGGYAQPQGQGYAPPQAGTPRGLTINTADKSYTDNYKDTGGGPPLPPSKDVDFLIIEGKEDTSNAGNCVLKVHLEVMGGVHQGKRFWNTYTVHTAVQYVRGLMKACWGQEKFQFDATEFNGCMFRANVIHQPPNDDGRVFMKLTDHRPVERAQPQSQSQPQAYQPQPQAQAQPQPQKLPQGVNPPSQGGPQGNPQGGQGGSPPNMW